MTEPKELAWKAYREAWNQKSSMRKMQPIQEKTARSKFERWWELNAPVDHDGQD